MSKKHRKTPQSNSDAVHNPNRMFHQRQLEPHSDAHDINITINMGNNEDGVVGCFKALVGCFKKGT